MLLSLSQKNFFFICSAMLLGTGVVANAVPVNVPSNVDSGQAAKRFEQPASPLSTPELNLPVPNDVGELSASAKRQLEQNKFILKSVEVDGATVFTSQELEFAYQDKIGETISLLDAKEIAKKITNLYREQGYILSQAVVPAQDLKNGVLKIRVVEGFVGSILVDGKELSDSEKKVLEDFANNIKKSRPVRSQDLERYLLLMNDLAGSKVNGTLRPSANKFGAADLVIKAEDKRYDVAYHVDNRGSKFIGPWQNTLSGSLNSALGMYDKTQVTLNSTLPTKELRGFEISHDEILGSEGTKLSFKWSRTRTKPGDSLKAIDIVGDSDIYEAKVTHPFIRQRRENLIGRAIFEAHNTNTDVFKNVAFTDDRLRAVRLGVFYNLIDDYNGNNVLDIQLSQGLNIFNASEDGVDRSNAIGESDYTKFNFDVSRVQGITNSVSLYAGATSQYSFDPLLVAEQFALGGAAFGTAYDPAEVLGDSGLAGKLELRYDNTIGAEYFQGYQAYTFYDIGRAWLRNVTSSANEKKSLTSAGAGIRMDFTDNLAGDLQVAFPLTKPASNRGDNGNDPRLFVGFTARF